MNDIEKINNQIIERDIIDINDPPESSDENPNIIAGILRRWHIAFMVFFLICAVSLPAIWLLIDPVYNVSGAIRIAPILADIMTNAKDSGDISNYEIFMNTQAEIITSNQVLQRVADDLQSKNLPFFENEAVGFMPKLKQKLLGQKINPDTVWLLKQAMSKGAIKVGADSKTELIRITVKSEKDRDAKQIVDSFIDNTMAVGQTNSTQDEESNLSILEDERKQLESNIDYYRQSIHQLAKEYGTDTLIGRQDMMLQRIAALQSLHIETKATKANLEAEVKLLERTKEGPIPPDELLKMRQDYINNDPMVMATAQNLAQLDQMLIAAEQELTPSNPEFKLMAERMEKMKEHLVELKEEANTAFDELLAMEIETSGDSELIRARTRLEHTTEFEKMLSETIEQEDSETRKLGQMQLQIEDYQDQLEIDKQRYENVIQRIQDLELQQKRPARMSVHYRAQTLSTEDKRIKYSAGIVFVSAVCGMWLAFLRDKADKRLRTPDDAAKRIGIRIIGTTTSLHAVKPALLPEQISGDYQTIRANLGLLDDEGIPHILVVTSPGMKEGKTTFAVNLATSLSKSGKRILLIDGDLRKPDVSRLLNLPTDSRGLLDFLGGIRFEQAVQSIASSGLDILAADSCSTGESYELLALHSTAERIKRISKKYDHVIIDTPPVLSFPDALIWAKLSDAVVLTSFAGQTTLPELKQAKERLLQINARVLGTVVSSVDAQYSYNRQDYDYYERSTQSRKTKRKSVI